MLDLEGRYQCTTYILWGDGFIRAWYDRHRPIGWYELGFDCPFPKTEVLHYIGIYIEQRVVVSLILLPQCLLKYLRQRSNDNLRLQLSERFVYLLGIE